MKSTFKNFAFLITLILFAIPSFAKVDNERTRTVTKEFEVNAGSTVSIAHKRGDIEVEYYDGDKAKLQVLLVVRGDVPEDLETVLSKYTFDIETFGDRTEVKSNSNIEKWSTNTGNLFSKGKYQIKFKDGSEITSRVSDIKADLKLWIPQISKLELSSRHEDIRGNDLPFSLDVKVYDGDLRLGNIGGALNLEIKHGSGTMGQLGNAVIELYDSRLKMKDAARLEIKTKHSDIEMSNAESIDLDIYDGEIILGNVASYFNIKEKHASITVNEIGNGTWDMYDSKVRVEKADRLIVKAKHGKYELKNIRSLDLDGYDITLNIGHLGKLSSKQAKHTKFYIDALENSLQFDNAYDAGINAPMVKIRGEDVKVELR